MSTVVLILLYSMLSNSVPDKKTGIIETFCIIKEMVPSNRLAVSLPLIQASTPRYPLLDPVSRVRAPCEISLLLSVARQIEQVGCGDHLVVIMRRVYVLLFTLIMVGIWFFDAYHEFRVLFTQGIFRHCICQRLRSFNLTIVNCRFEYSQL